MTRHVVCKESDLSVGQMKRFKAGDTSILVYRLADGVYATQNSCTHMFAPLTRGKIMDGERIRCPLHRAEFDIRTGKRLEGLCRLRVIEEIHPHRAQHQERH